jgi:hypothetical protein
MKEGVNSSLIYLIHSKNFCKCHNVCPPSTIIKNKYDCRAFATELYDRLRMAIKQSSTNR